MVDKIRIGIVPAKDTVDRFRYEPLLHGLNKLGHDVRLINNNRYDDDVIIVSLKNLKIFPLFNERPKVIIGDVTDDLFSRPLNRYNFLGKIYNLTQLYRNYAYYVRLIKLCNCIVVGSGGQAECFSKYQKHISVITDPVLDADCGISGRYIKREQCHLVWFGSVWSLYGLATIQDVLDKLGQAGQFILHIITAPTVNHGRLLGAYPSNVYEFIKRQKIACQFHAWSPSSYSKVIASCDIVLIPVDAKSSYTRNKPPGRVLLAMALGLPVVASAIPSHQSVIKHNENGYLALKTDEWLQIISELAKSIDNRKVIGTNAQQYARGNYNEDIFVKKYHDVICSCI